MEPIEILIKLIVGTLNDRAVCRFQIVIVSQSQ